MIESKILELRPERCPFFCQWELTCRCNLQCIMCYTDCFNTPEKIRQELSTEEIFRILDEMYAEGLAEVAYTGGEPFSRSDFFEIYEYTVQKGILATILSNGTLITEQVADRLADMPPTRVEISLHGISASTFETVTQNKGSFEKCLKAIRLLLERNIIVVLKITAMNINKDEILAVKDYVSGLKGAKFQMGEKMRLALDGSDHPRQYELSHEALDEIESRDATLWKEACEKKSEACRSGYYSFHIDAYGQLQLCSGNRRKGYDLRSGGFKEGFYQFLPTFPCPLKNLGERKTLQLTQDCPCD